MMLSVQGCDVGTTAHAVTTSAHDVTVAEAQAAYQAYLTSADTSAQQGNSTTGLAATEDAEWLILHGQYAANTSSGIPVPRYQYGTPAFYVPAQGSGYPHWFVVSVPRRALGTSQDADATTLMLFEQPRSGSPWMLNGTAALAAGQQLPAVAIDNTGYAVAVSRHDSSLLVPPDVVGATQAAVVDDGPGSAAAAVVAPGPDTIDMYTRQSAYGQAQNAKNLSYSWLMQGATFPQFALRLSDGGALVLYGMYLNTTTEHKGAHADSPLPTGPPIPVPADFTPILVTPGQIGTHVVYANWTYQFAAYDPPATAKNGKLGVIAATGGPTYGKAALCVRQGARGYQGPDRAKRHGQSGERVALGLPDLAERLVGHGDSGRVPRHPGGQPLLRRSGTGGT